MPSYMISAFLPGGTEQQYEQIKNHVEESIGDTPPEGAISHTAGRSEDGWLVCEVWASQDAWLRFRADHLAPAFEKAGVPINRLELRTAEVAVLQTIGA